MVDLPTVGQRTSDEFAKEVAEKYIEFTGTPLEGRPTQILQLAAHYGVNHFRASRWVQTARKRGFLDGDYRNARKPDSFYRQIAKDYLAACELPGRNRSSIIIAEKYGVKVSTAHGWTKAARHLGFLEGAVLRTCSKCGSPLGEVPPSVPQHHRASVTRMLQNAENLKARCEELAKEARDQGLNELADAFLGAMCNYGLVIGSLDSASKQVKAIYTPVRLGEGRRWRRDEAVHHTNGQGTD